MLALASLLLGVSARAANTEGLLGYWTFEEGTGTATADQSGNGLIGTFDKVALWGGPTWTNSPLGTNALRFDGVDDRVYLGNPASLQLTGAMTVSAWIKIASPSAGRIVSKCPSAYRVGWELYVGTDNQASFAVHGTNDPASRYAVTTANPLPDNQWTHVAAVFEPGAACRIFVNGSLSNERTDAVPVEQESRDLDVTIGARPDTAGTGNPNGPFPGWIDEVRMWGRALTAAEIQALPELAQTPLAFTIQPASRLVAETRSATFTAQVSGSPPYFAQWFENGWPIAGASDFTYTIPAVTTSMNNYQYSVVISNLTYGITSTNAILTVSTDTTPPTLVSVGSVDGASIGLRFSKPMDQNLMWDPSYFQVNNGAAPISWTMPRPDGTSASIYLASPITGPFTVRITGLRDTIGNTIVPGSAASGTMAGWTAADLGVPPQVGETFSAQTGVFEITAGGADLWGTADAGHFVGREISGDFDVYVQVPSVTPVNSGAKAGLMARTTLDANSRTIHVTANPPAPAGRGYIEAGRRTSTGGSTAAWGTTFTSAAMPDVWVRLRRWENQFTAFRSTDGVDWVRMGLTTVALTDPVYLGLAATAHSTTSDPTLAILQNYGSMVFSNVTLTVAQAPASASVEQNTTAAFQVQAEGTGAPETELAYQWQRSDGAGGFTNISGATGTNYSFLVRSADQGASFRARVYFAGLVKESDAAVLTVTPDVTPPQLVSVASRGIPTVVTVVFSEDMDPASATNVANYQIASTSGSVAVTAAAMGSNARTVVLTTDPLVEGPAYTLSVSQVYDLGAPPNPINAQQAFDYSSLAGYYKFEEGTGTTTADSSGGGYTGTLYNNPLWIPGYFGQHALDFNGVNSRVQIGNQTVFQITGPISLSAWVWVRTISGNGRIVTKGGGSGQRGWSLNVENSDNWAFQIGSNPTTTLSVNSPGIPRQVWIHVAGVYDPSDPGGPIMKLYTNGVLAASRTDGVPATQNNSSQNVNIGNRSSGTPFDGYIDEVRIYTRALSEAEIAVLAQPPVEPEPLEFLAPAIEGASLRLDWTGTGQLEWAPAATGPWSKVSPAPEPPYMAEIVAGENRFYRLQASP